jgi:hypothetical protein
LDHFPLFMRARCRLQTFETKEEFPAFMVSGERHMLTDAALKKLKPKDKVYKVADRDGLYVSVLSSGVVSFRYNYAINGRQETLVLGRYGPEGITLKEARETLAQAKKSVLEGRSPARLRWHILRVRPGGIGLLRRRTNVSGGAPLLLGCSPFHPSTFALLYMR